MLPDEQEALLGDILIYTKKILAFTQGVSPEAFAANEEKQFAVIRCLEIIGEAVNHLSPEAQNELSSVQLRLIRGMRNRLVHDYRNVSTRIIWETITNDLAPLIHALESRLPKDTSFP
jgi:uncharacterized protein with HEPN domain